MIIYDLVAAFLESLAGYAGLQGVAIGALAAAVVGLYYLREVADLMVLVARYARVASLIGAAVLLVLVAGQATGYLELGTSELLGAIGETINQVINH